MKNELINAKVEDLKTLEMAKKNIDTKIKAIQADLKECLKKEGVDELSTDKYIIRNKSVTSHRFDTKKFKVEHSSLYESYLVESVSERFSIK